MIQLRKIRFSTPKGVEPRSYEAPLNPPVESESIAKLFLNLDKAIDAIPPEDRFNIYYTIGYSEGDKKKEWVAQDVIPFDIDGVVDANGEFDEEKYLKVIGEALNVDLKKCIIVASGNGIQILVQISSRIESKKFFQNFRPAYNRICGEIARALQENNLQFKEVDPSSFAPNRLFRLPGTENQKKDLPTRMARVLNGALSPQPFSISPADKKDPLHIPEDAQLTEKQLSFFKIDSPAVEQGCKFIQWSKVNQSVIGEPQWYATLSILSRLENGREKCHEYSREHHSYSQSDTDRKIDQAMAASGPRTCENIDTLWDNCHTCPFYKKVNSPVAIKSETFIATAHSGFHKLTEKGGLKPQYEDLRRYFNQEKPYRSHEETGLVYVWDGAKYAIWSDTKLRSYAHDKFDPKPEDRATQEFKQWVNRTQLVSKDWFKDSINNVVNFKNGMLNLDTMVLSPHSPDQGFLYVLPYNYELDAKCPNFEAFMLGIMGGDVDLVRVLLEIVGYGICDRTYWLQKAPLLIGEGSNGKSTFLKVVECVAGRENVGFLSLSDLQHETSRSMLEGKLINISDELPNYSIKNTEMLKKLFGGMMTARKLYHDGVAVENTAKFIFAGNAIPSSSDLSDGFFRRFVIVPFTTKFQLGPQTGGNAADPNLIDKLRLELPGIFNLVLRNYRALKARGYLLEARRSTEEMEIYREDVDRPGTWIKDNLYWNGSWDSSKPYLESSVVYEKYVSDCKRWEERPLSRQQFTAQLRRHIAHFNERKGRGGTDGKGSRIIRGIQFKDDTGEEKPHF